MLLRNLDRDEFQEMCPKLRELYTKAYRLQPRYAYQEVAKIESYLGWLYDGDPSGFFVASLNETAAQVVGFAAVHGWGGDRDGRSVAELHELVVDPQWQGRGIGTALIRRAARHARHRGCRAMALWVGEENQRAVALYERLGFRCTGQGRCWVRMELPV